MRLYEKVAAMGLAGFVGLAASSMANCGSCSGDSDCSVKSCPMGKAEGCQMACPVASGKTAVINTAALAALVRAKSPVTILDARSGKFDDGKRIPGAGQLSPQASDEDIAKALPDKKATIITYCAGVKCPASKALADTLKKHGYENVIEYPEGIAGWIDAGNTTEQKGK